MKQPLNDFYDWLKAASTPIMYILMGVGAVLTDHYRKGTLTMKQAIVSGVMGVVSGYLAWSLCHAQGWESHAGYLIPVATMAGERVVPYLIQVSPEWIKKIFEKKIDG